MPHTVKHLSKHLSVTSFALVTIAACTPRADNAAQDSSAVATRPARPDSTVEGISPGYYTDRSEGRAQGAEVRADSTAPSAPIDDPTLVRIILLVDQGEVSAARMALQKASSAEVKTFASAMIEAHQRHQAKMRGIMQAGAPTTGVSAPDTTSAVRNVNPLTHVRREQQEAAAAMNSATGTAFDRVYIDAQLAGHDALLSLLQRAAPTGGSTVLRQELSALQTLVAEHRDSARALQLKLAGRAAASGT